MRLPASYKYLIFSILIIPELLVAVDHVPAVQTYECFHPGSSYRTGKWLSWTEAYEKVIEDQPTYFLIFSGGYYGTAIDWQGGEYEVCTFNSYNIYSGYTGEIDWYGGSPYACEYNIGSEHITIGNGNLVNSGGEAKCEVPTACDCDENLVGSQCVPMEKATRVAYETNVTKVYEYPPNNQGQLCPPTEKPEQDCKSGNTTFGNPIDCANGQKVQIETDYQGAGTDPLRYTRAYQSPLSNDPNSNPTSGLSWLDTGQPGFSIQVYEDGAQLGLFTIGHKVMRTLFNPSVGSGWSSNPYMDPINMVDGTGGGRSVSYKGKVYHINTAGQNEAIEDRGIQRYTYSYNAAGLVSEIRNRFGAFLQFTYNADNHLIRLTDQSGSEIHYTYDTEGNLHQVIYPDATPRDLSDNPRKTYLYEKSGFPYHLTGIIDESGLQFASFDYDANGRGILSEHADGAERVVFSYPEEGKAIVRFYRDNDTDVYREEAYTYGKFRGAYQLTSRTIQACNNCTLGSETWTYDYKGLLLKYKNMNGVLTTYTYDSDGRKLSETVGSGTSLARTTNYTWDSDLQKILTITTDNTVTQYIYNVNGLLLSKTQHPNP